MKTNSVQKFRERGLISILILCLFFLQAEAGVRQDPEPAGNKREGELIANLFFSDRKGEFLRSENRQIPAGESSEQTAIRIVNNLIEGPREDLLPTLPKETKLLALFITGNGTAVVDFDPAIREKYPFGVNTERLTVYSIVNSLVLNIEAITSVKFLLKGRETDTLAGHWDVRQPLKANMLLIR